MIDRTPGHHTFIHAFIYSFIDICYRLAVCSGDGRQNHTQRKCCPQELGAEGGKYPFSREDCGELLPGWQPAAKP